MEERKKKKGKDGAIQVGSERNSAVYGSRLFCTSKYTEKSIGGKREGGVAAGHFIVIVSPRSCGSAYALFLFFCFSPFPFFLSPQQYQATLLKTLLTQDHNKRG